MGSLNPRTISLTGRVEVLRLHKPSPADDALDSQIRVRLQALLDAHLAEIERALQELDYQQRALAHGQLAPVGDSSRPEEAPIPRRAPRVTSAREEMLARGKGGRSLPAELNGRRVFQASGLSPKGEIS